MSSISPVPGSQNAPPPPPAAAPTPPAPPAPPEQQQAQSQAPASNTLNLFGVGTQVNSGG
jgi:hypothetical protein